MIHDSCYCTLVIANASTNKEIHRYVDTDISAHFRYTHIPKPTAAAALLRGSRVWHSVSGSLAASRAVCPGPGALGRISDTSPSVSPAPALIASMQTVVVMVVLLLSWLIRNSNYPPPRHTATESTNHSCSQHWVYHNVCKTCKASDLSEVVPCGF